MLFPVVVTFLRHKIEIFKRGLPDLPSPREADDDAEPAVAVLGRDGPAHVLDKGPHDRQSHAGGFAAGIDGAEAVEHILHIEPRQSRGLVLEGYDTPLSRNRTKVIARQRLNHY